MMLFHRQRNPPKQPTDCQSEQEDKDKLRGSMTGGKATEEEEGGGEK